LKAPFLALISALEIFISASAEYFESSPLFSANSPTDLGLETVILVLPLVSTVPPCFAYIPIDPFSVSVVSPSNVNSPLLIIFPFFKAYKPFTLSPLIDNLPLFSTSLSSELTIAVEFLLTLEPLSFIVISPSFTTPLLF